MLILVDFSVFGAKNQGRGGGGGGGGLTPKGQIAKPNHFVS